jgi:hypothetical protein
MTTEKIEKIKLRIEVLEKNMLAAKETAKQLKLEYIRIENKQKLIDAKKARTLENRKKILIGAFFMEKMKIDKQFEDKVLANLNSFYTKKSERDVFGFQDLDKLSQAEKTV